jgi:hypothetical protein
MPQRLTMVYWKGEQMWLGKLLEFPVVMTQGETVEGSKRTSRTPIVCSSSRTCRPIT